MTDNKEREALKVIAEWPVTHPTANMDAANMRDVARTALAASQEKAEPVALRKTFEEWLGEVVADGGCTVEALLVGDTDPIRCARSAWDACLASLYAAPVAAQAHPDDAAVDRFAIAMKEKLAIAREKGRSGWENMDPAELSLMLRQHVEKGDPRDVANFCMFLWALGERIGDSVLPYGKRAVAAQASEPVAWMTEDARVATNDTKINSMSGPSRDAFNIPLYIAPQPSASNADARTIAEIAGELDDPTLTRYSQVATGIRDLKDRLAAPQPSAEAVRDAALDEAANTATGFLVGDPLAGIPLRNPMTHEIADAIRALKSAPPQPAEQPSASPFPLFESGYALTDEEITKLAESMPGGLEGFLKGWGWQNFARAVESEVMLAIARAQGEQA